MPQGLFEGKLPPIKGKPIARSKGDKLKVARANCPVHGSLGRETNWRPGEGLHPDTREFECVYYHHAFYIMASGKPEKCVFSE